MCHSFVNLKPFFVHDVEITCVVVVMFFPLQCFLGWFSANKKQSLFFKIYISLNVDGCEWMDGWMDGWMDIALGSVVCFIVCQRCAYCLFGFRHTTTR